MKKVTLKDKNLKIKNYYNRVQKLYDIIYSKGTNHLHYGFWNKNTKSIKESLMNPLKFLCKILKINNKDIILDAGCGIGGTSIYIAKNYRAKVIGLTISDVQLNRAEELKFVNNLQSKIKFFKDDYTKTHFKNSSFTKIFGIESICYAHKKLDFIKEAYRLLKKEGKLVVIDAFLLRDNLNKNEEKILKNFLEGWAVPNLSTIKSFKQDLKKVGFKNIRYYDKFKEIKKTRDRIYRLAKIGYLPGLIAYKLGLVPKEMHFNTLAGLSQKKLFSKRINMATYGIFIADK